MKPFHLLLLRRPVSLNRGKRNDKYQSSVAAEASKAMVGRETLKGRLYARIIWFHVEPTSQDTDNIVKPILDSLTGIVFVDDIQVGECHVSRIDASLSYTFIGVPEAEIFTRLSKFLAKEEKHIVFIEIGESPEQIADFGLEQEKS